MAERKSAILLFSFVSHYITILARGLKSREFLEQLVSHSTSSFALIHGLKCILECTLLSRTLNKLSDALARSRLEEGRYSDGGGLYLNVKASGTKSWIFMYARNGRRHAIGLGSYPALRMPQARQEAVKLRQSLAEGADPKLSKATNAMPTFGDCVDLFLASMEGQWRNDKHKAQWRMTLGPAYCRAILEMHVSEVSTDHVLKVLDPVWTKKPETASRLRGRVERVLDYAKTRGWRSGENPALWRGHLKNILPARQKLTRGHHAAMPYADLPAFLVRLRMSQGVAARALEFLILCAARSGEVLGCRWDEVDFKRKLWEVPAARMKAGRPHRVPLSDDAIALLSGLSDHRQSDFVFPGQKEKRPLSPMAMEMQLRRMKLDDVTVHGFRSSFRDWAGEETSHPREIAEAALAHVVGDATERAYRRGDALEKRRILMIDWSQFCRG